MGAIEELLATKPDRAAIDRFLEGRDFPIVEDTRVTFAFHGQAEGVNLRHFIYGLPASQPLQRVDGTDLWHLSMELPERSRVEYKIERVLDVWRAGDVAGHARRLAEQHVHRHIDHTIVELCVTDDELPVVGQLPDDRVRAVFACTQRGKFVCTG